MLDAVVLILREVLEAALIMSLLLALSRQLGWSRRWIWPALAGGFACSWLMAQYAYGIAEAFDGTGQELLNVLLYGAVIAGFWWAIGALAPLACAPNRALANLPEPAGGPLRGSFVLILVAAIAREGSEIWIYLSSFSGQPGLYTSALMGGALGLGIGASLGIILYFALLGLDRRGFLWLFIAYTGLFSAGLAMQIAQQLMQVGLLESGQPLWDSSALVAGHSWLGELLYALVGYDARPTGLQVLFYLGVILPVLALLARACWCTRGGAGHVQ